MGMRNKKTGEAQGAIRPTDSLYGMNAVELFCGIGGFRIAADAWGVKTRWANDICPKACAVYRSKFGKGEVFEGDIKSGKGLVPPHNLLTGGFPCQPFSSAGKKKGVRDPRGTLFQEIIDVLAAHQPTMFVLENVRRLLTMEQGFHFATILASLGDLSYRIEWRLLNAMDFGLPQNRQRVFIVGIHERQFEKRPATSRSLQRVRLANLEDLPTHSSHLLDLIWEDTNWKPIEKHGKRFPSWGMARSGRFIGDELPRFSDALPQVGLREVLEPHTSPEFDFTETTMQWISQNTPVNRLVQGVEILSNQSGGARMGYTIFGINGVAPTLTSTTSRHYERYRIGDRYRRLTNVEYARIQGFPDTHCDAVSVYDQYALIGNSVPPAMASWVLGRLSNDGIGPSDIPNSYRQLDLFSYANER